MANYSIEYLERIMWDGKVDVDCTADCGESRTIEPDCDAPCECGEGRFTSPLIEVGLI